MGFWANRTSIAASGLILGVVGILFIAPQATAEIAYPDVALRIEINSDAGAAVFEVALDDFAWDSGAQLLWWEAEEAIELIDPGSEVLLATLESAEFEIVDCSKINLNLGLLAGTENVTVVASSGLLEFPAIPADSAEARASASLFVRDLDGDGVYIMGEGGDGTGACRAYYNGDAQEGVRFTHLVSLVSAGNGGSASGSQSAPPAGYLAVNQEVWSMELTAAFVLSANDRAAAACSYDFNPDPEACELDTDGDGLPDWLDGCPEDPDKFVPGDNGCGVPEGEDPDDVVLDRDDEDSPADPVVQAPQPRDRTGDDKLSGDEGDPRAEPVTDSVTEPQLTGDDFGRPLDGIAPSCGVGAVGMASLTCLGLAGCKLGGRNRRR